MTRSIFDPTGGETEHSGSRNLGPDASEISHLPPDIAGNETDSTEDNVTIDMNPSAEGDAPQEADIVDALEDMMEGQATDDSDSPREQSE